MCLKKIFREESRVLAYKFYEERDKESGHELEDFVKAENMIVWRVRAGLFYLALGILLIISAKHQDCCSFIFIYQKFASVLNFVINCQSINDVYIWCVGWTAIGLGAGLINTRMRPYRIWWMQHVCYCGFVLLVISILSYVIPAYLDKSLPGNNLPDKFYLFSMLIGLIGGFLGDTLNEIAKNLLKIPRV